MHHQKHRRSLHSGSSQACSEPTHLTPCGAALPEKTRRASRSRTGGLGFAKHPSPLLLHAAEAILIDPSAWNRNPRKVISRILHNSAPNALGSPLQAPRLTEDPQAPICTCYDGWVFLGVQTEDADEIIEAVPYRRCQ